MHIDIRLHVPLTRSREFGCCVRNVAYCASIVYSCERQHCVAWCPSSQVAHHGGALYEVSRLSQLTSSDRQTLKLAWLMEKRLESVSYFSSIVASWWLQTLCTYRTFKSIALAQLTDRTQPTRSSLRSRVSLTLRNYVALRCTTLRERLSCYLLHCKTTARTTLIVFLPEARVMLMFCSATEDDYCLAFACNFQCATMFVIGVWTQVAPASTQLKFCAAT